MAVNTKKASYSAIGTIDKGRDFEKLMTARVLLDLATSNAVKDFQLSTNVPNVGKFDDIVLTIDKNLTYGIQLKYISDNRNITAASLGTTIQKLYESYVEIDKTTNLQVVLVMKTTATYDSKTLTISEKKCVFKPTHVPFFLKTIKAVKSYSAKPEDELELTEKLQEFTKNFIFVTTTTDIDTLKDSVLNDLSTQFLLPKEYALHALPLVAPNSPGKSPTGPEKLFAKILTEFDITIFSEDREPELLQFIANAITEVNLKDNEKLLNEYQLGNFNESKQKVIVAWLKGTLPILVKSTSQITEVLALSRKFILMSDEAHCKILKNSFVRLKNVESKRPYEEFLSSCHCKIQGKDISLKTLTEQSNKITEIIKPNELILMIYDKCAIGTAEELPQCHIPRLLTRHVFDSNIFNTDSKLLITNAQEFPTEKYKEHKNITFKNENLDVTDNQTKDGAHCFEVLNDQELEWIQSTTNIEDLMKCSKCPHRFLNENNVISYENKTNVHLVCSLVGMGKTTLMRTIANNSSTQYWTIFVEVRNHYEHFNSHKDALEPWLTYILEQKQKELERFAFRIYEVFFNSHKIRWIWDGLDEFQGDVSIVCSLINKLSKCGTQQWVTARDNLKNKLETDFNVFSRDIQSLSIEQEMYYIRQRLSLDDDKNLSTVFNYLKSNVNFMNVPIHIYILTELLRNDQNKYKKLMRGMFTILDLYESFINEKFALYFKEKENLRNQYSKRNLEYKSTRIKLYQRMALNLYFNASQLKCLSNNRNFGTEQIDEIGIVHKMVDQTRPQFIHSFVGDYLAASFLAENCKDFGYIQEFFFEEKYSNIRFFFDLMLSRHLTAHTAALCRNWNVLDQCSNTELAQTDCHGRSVLHLMSSWGRRFPDTKLFQLCHTMPSFQVKEDPCYVARFEKIIQICTFEPDNIFKLDPFVLAQKTNSMLSLGVLTAMTRNFSGCAFEAKKTNTLIACLMNDYSKIFQGNFMIPDREILSIYIHRKIFIEQIAVTCNAITSIQTILCSNRKQFNVNASNFKNQNLLHLCCQLNLADIGKLLIANGADINAVDDTGKTPLHCTIDNDDIDMAVTLIDNGASIDQTDNNGDSTLLRACAVGRTILVQTLLQRGANVNKPNKLGFTPVFLASDRGYHCIVDTLLSMGANPNLGPNLEVIHFFPAKTTQAIERTHKRFIRIVIFNATPLHAACANNHLETVKLLLKHGAHINPGTASIKPIHVTTNPDILQELLNNGAEIDVTGVLDHRQPIHFACCLGALPILDLLIANNANVNALSGHKQQPIHDACEFGQLEIVRELIAHGAHTDNSDDKGWTPMHYACKGGNLDIIKMLARPKLDEPVMETQLRPIHIACRFGHLQLVEFLLEAQINANASDSLGHKPIDFISLEAGDNYPAKIYKENSFQMLQLLIKKSANTIDTDEEKGRLLHAACRIGDIGTIQDLLARGVNVNTTNKAGLKPIDAITSDNGDLVGLLISQGADITQPLHSYFNKGWFNTCKAMLQHGANQNETDNNGMKLIHRASQKPNMLEFLRYLIENGAGVNDKIENGATPLHLACAAGCLDNARLLLNHGADLTCVDNQGYAAIHAAACTITAKFYPVMSLLLLHGVNINVRTSDGIAPLHLACFWGRNMAVKYFEMNCASFNIQDKEGSTPLHYAIFRYLSDVKDDEKQQIVLIIKTLLSNGVDRNARDILGFSAIDYARFNHCTEAVELLTA